MKLSHGASESLEPIPLVNLKIQVAILEEKLTGVIRQVLADGRFIGGPTVANFEEKFAIFSGAAHCVGVGNGTDALFLTLKALGVSEGDEVILPSHTFTATAEAVRLVGGRPVFAEIDEATFNIDPEDVANKITPKTRALLPVHLYGRPADIPSLEDLSSSYGVDLVYDAAQAHGALHRGTPIARFGRASVFSFYPGKNLGAFGDAGAVLSNDEMLANHARMLANHGRAKKYTHELSGVNSRIDSLQAAILSLKLDYLSEWCDARRRHATAYSERLVEFEKIRLPDLGGEDIHGMHLFVIRVPAPDREGLIRYLHERKIETGIHYPIPLHMQPCNRDLGYKEGSFPVTERLVNEVLSLPMFPELTEPEIDRVSEAIKGYFGER
ncbi:MAG: DegT/DnrJ/EryC1/StrS family aminotransferase [Nitrospinota bacterium]|jgi:dTDP-4-amino-4,6-dideoxygalactose transaminase|nr:DegT/DnrJ/EryC1/StrS family aminotransferase [Nitrospinota bacterium]